MKNTNKNCKKIYFPPHIDCVKLDAEISLAMESTPPDGEDEVNNSITPGFLNKDPFKNQIG